MKTVGLTLATIAAAGLNLGPAVAAPSIYIPLGAANQVQIVDAASHRIVGAIENVGNAHGLAITPDGRRVVAGSYAEEAPGGAVSPPRPAGVSEAEHEKHHAKSDESQPSTVGTSFVSVADTDTRKVIRRVAVKGAVHHVAISPDGATAITTHPGAGGISVIDLARYETIATVATGAAPNYAVFTVDGRGLYVSNAGDNDVSKIDVATWSVTRRIPAGRSPEHLVLSPDGDTLYVNNVGDGTASAISLSEGRVVRTFPVGLAPHGIDLSDDGATLFATSNGENRLVAIDLAGGRTGQIAIGPAPYHLTTVRGSGTLYVSSRAENRLWVVDQKTLAIRGEVAIGGIGHQMAMASD